MQSARRTWRWCIGTFLGVGVSLAIAETTEKAAPPEGTQAKGTLPYVGEVTGDSVYVRCRPDQNWYPTTKLKLGDRVEVFDEQFGWLKIRPPRGSFCYVDKKLVTKEGTEKGVINADNVYIRAGSDVPDHTRKKTGVVTQLSNGAEVKILSEHPDGYYQIAPPKEAFYWVSSKFIRRVGDASVAGGEAAAPSRTESPKNRDKESVKAPSEAPAPSVEPTTSAPSPSPAEPSPRLVDVWQKKLDLIDAELKAALRQQPLREADFRSLRKQFEPIADQDDEIVPKEYAKVRLQQIDNVLERIAIRARIERLSQTAAVERKLYAPILTTTSAPAQAAPAPVAAKPDYEGKLVRSFAFEGRYRIVDPQEGKTLVYLEIPAGSNIDANQFIGRIVKIRAKSKRYDNDARRNIVEPAEIVTVESDVGAATQPGAPAPSGPPGPDADSSEKSEK